MVQNDNSNSEGQTADSREAVSNVQDESRISPQPHQEQLHYWKRDLLFKLISLVISILGFTLIVIGLRVNSQQVAINADQLRLNTAQSLRTEKSMCSNVQIAVLNHVVNLDRLFMDKPYLRPYFYDGREVSETEEKFDELSATSEMVLDIFDLVADQSRKNPECWDRPKLWDEWIIDTFSTSPILRDTLSKYSTWYEEPLMSLREEGRRRLEEKPKTSKAIN
jgi:hypothetical protein